MLARSRRRFLRKNQASVVVTTGCTGPCGAYGTRSVDQHALAGEQAATARRDRLARDGHANSALGCALTARTPVCRPSPPHPERAGRVSYPAPRRAIPVNIFGRMQPSRPAHRNMLLARYAYDLGVPLTEFLVRLGLCASDAARAHIEAGAFRLDGQVLSDPSRVIRTADLRSGSVAVLFDQRVTLSFWSDEDDSPPAKPPTRALLLVHSLERWEEFNEYEGSCRATWNGREYCFRVLLVGDEWDRVRVGFTWEAEVHFDPYSPVELLDDSPDLTAGISPVAGINHILCGRILGQVEDGVNVAAPQTVLVTASERQLQGAPVEPGRWLRARGTMEARMPD